MVNKEVIKKWVDWLEDKNNKQGRGHLKRGEAHCCLGGLAIVMGMEFKPVTTTERELQIGCNYIDSKHGKSTVSFPDDVWEQLGMEEEQGYYMYLNDGEGKTFQEIATFIRQKYLVTETV